MQNTSILKTPLDLTNLIFYYFMPTLDVFIPKPHILEISVSLYTILVRYIWLITVMFDFGRNSKYLIAKDTNRFPQISSNLAYV